MEKLRSSALAPAADGSGPSASREPQRIHLVALHPIHTPEQDVDESTAEQRGSEGVAVEEKPGPPGKRPKPVKTDGEIE